MKLTANPAWLSLPAHRGKGSGAKFLRIMKLTTIIILAACLHTSAKGVAQQTITFSGKEVSLESVFTAIKKQTNYRFFFNTDMLRNASKITLEVKNAQIEQVMNMALKDQPLIFTIKGRTIFIMKKPEDEKKSSQVERTGDPITVSGKVTDENGAPAQGVNIIVKGTNKGTTTNLKGEFVLNDVKENDILLISSVGYDRQEVPVRNTKVINTQLKLAVGSLDETVVIAYGTTSKRFNTGNITSLKSTDIEKQPVNNPLLALQGRVPGLFVTQSSGLPGAGVIVRVQGQNSIGKGNDPLYVIDGMPYTSQLLPNVGGIGVLGSSGTSGINGNPLNFINPADIESIDVLKDADATAIFGSRAANGAILITTKKGKAGKTKLDINIQKGFGEITRKMDLLNTLQYLEMRKEAKLNDKASVLATDFDINGIWDTTKYTDWQEVLIGGTAEYNDAQMTVSGGSSNTQFLLSAGYHGETTVFPGDFSDKKGSIHFNINNISNDQRFRMDLSGNYLVDNNILLSQDFTGISLRLAPNAPDIYNEDGTLNWAPLPSGVSTWTNPLSYLHNKYKNKTHNLISNLVLSYRILPGVTFKSSFGYSNLYSNEVNISPLVSKAPEIRPNSSRQAIFSDNKITSWIIEPQVSYIKTIGKGKLDVLIGATIQERNSRSEQIGGIGQNSDLILEDIKSAPTVLALSSIATDYKYNALFSRINYNWREKYIFNLTARRDGSSRFGSKNLFHDFGSAAIGWIVSNEHFMQRNLHFISFLKLRASYGSTGNDQIGDYQFLNLYNSVNVGVPYQGTMGISVNRISNPYLQWEETKKLQFGIELGVLRDRLLLNASYNINRSSNQLLAYALPIITGVTEVTRNFPATVQNSDLELSLTAINVKNKVFSWTSSVNITVPKNKLVAFPNLEKSTYASTLIIGQPISIIRAFDFVGVDPATGVYNFRDFKGDITFSPNSVTDKIININTLPRYYGGIQNSFNYNRLQLDVLFQFVKQLGSNYYFGNNPGSNGINQPITIWDRWKKPDDIAPIQRYNSNNSLVQSNVNARINSNAGYSDASYIRLKNVSLSWQVPDRWTQKARLQSFKIFAQGQNLLTITNYIGLDPENRSTASLPPLRVITFGIRVAL